LNNYQLHLLLPEIKIGKIKPEKKLKKKGKFSRKKKGKNFQLSKHIEENKREIEKHNLQGKRAI